MPLLRAEGESPRHVRRSDSGVLRNGQRPLVALQPAPRKNSCKSLFCDQWFPKKVAKRGKPLGVAPRGKPIHCWVMSIGATFSSNRPDRLSCASPPPLNYMTLNRDELAHCQLPRRRQLLLQ